MTFFSNVLEKSTQDHPATQNSGPVQVEKFMRQANLKKKEVQRTFFSSFAIYQRLTQV